MPLKKSNLQHSCYIKGSIFETDASLVEYVSHASVALELTLGLII